MWSFLIRYMLWTNQKIKQSLVQNTGQKIINIAVNVLLHFGLIDVNTSDGYSMYYKFLLTQIILPFITYLLESIVWTLWYIVLSFVSFIFFTQSLNSHEIVVILKFLLVTKKQSTNYKHIPYFLIQFPRKLFFFEFGNPKVTVHKAKGQST